MSSKAATGHGLGDEWIDEAWLKLRRSAFWRFNKIVILYFLVSVLFGGVFNDLLGLIWYVGNLVILLRLVSRLARRLGLTSAAAEAGGTGAAEAAAVNASAVVPDGRGFGWWTAIERSSVVIGIIGALVGVLNWLDPTWLSAVRYTLVQN